MHASAFHAHALAIALLTSLCEAILLEQPFGDPERSHLLRVVHEFWVARCARRIPDLHRRRGVDCRFVDAIKFLLGAYDLPLRQRLSIVSL